MTKCATKQAIHPRKNCREFPDARSWDDYRDIVAEVMIETVNRFAPNFGASVIARQIHSPLDLERKFGLIDGDIFHGQLGLDQLFAASVAQHAS